MADPSVRSPAQHSFVLLGLLGRFCDLPRGQGLLLNPLDDAHCYSLTHVAHCKATWEIKIIRKIKLVIIINKVSLIFVSPETEMVDRERPRNTLA